MYIVFLSRCEQCEQGGFYFWAFVIAASIAAAAVTAVVCLAAAYIRSARKKQV